ncbi:hypothetical protein Tco_0805568 [Tanacetum coccineum]
MEEELYNLIVKGNDLKPYVRRFQELMVLCPNIVPNNDKLLEAFIGGLPQSIEGNVTASKPQTLKEAINIAQRLMDQVTKHAPNAKNGRYDGDLTFVHETAISIIKDLVTGKMYIATRWVTLSRTAETRMPANGSNQLPVTVVCQACGRKGHYTIQVPQDLHQCPRKSLNAGR